MFLFLKMGFINILFFPSSLCDPMIFLDVHRFVDEFVSELIGLCSNSCTGFRCPGLKLAPERSHSIPHTHRGRTEAKEHIHAQRMCVEGGVVVAATDGESILAMLKDGSHAKLHVLKASKGSGKFSWYEHTNVAASCTILCVYPDYRTVQISFGLVHKAKSSWVFSVQMSVNIISADLVATSNYK